MGVAVNRSLAPGLARRMAAWAAACSFALAPLWALAAERHAVLIGVGTYMVDADTGAPSVSPLEGPPHDVVAMREVLVTRWGFKPDSVRVLVNQQATRDAILSALNGLKARTKPGDEVVVYFSGHGTSWLDANTQSMNLASDSGAWVPHDFTFNSRLSDAQRAAKLIRGDVDLKPIFRDLDGSGRLLWVISDSCFSGSLSRSLAAAPGATNLPNRMLALPVPADYADTVQRLERAAATQQRPWPYRQAAFLLASAAAEPAVDIPARAQAVLPTMTGRPHGALTDALLRVLNGRLPSDFDRDGLINLHEVQRAVGDFMAQRPYGHAPVRAPGIAEDASGAGVRPLLSARAVALPASPGTTPAATPPLVVHLSPKVSDDLRRAVTAQPNVRVQAALDAQVQVQILPRGDGRPGWLLATVAGDTLLNVPEGGNSAVLVKLQQLQFAQGFRALATAGQRSALPVSIEPSTSGSSRLIGDQVRFAVLPDRGATLLLLNLDSEGRVSVLYPFNRGEASPVPGGKALSLPSVDQPAIVVEPPVGMDVQFALAFDRTPEGFDGLIGARQMPTEDRRVRMVMGWLSGMKGAYTFGSTELITLPKSKP
jgi:hypothetical protein